MFSAFLIIFIAGVINGSFALFTKYFKSWRFENIWLGFAVIAFLFAPWIIGWTISPEKMIPLHQVSSTIIWVVVIGGFCFGIGQACFASAMKNIGIGLAFLLNIGIGTVLGSLLPLLLQHIEELRTTHGWATVIASLLIVVGLILCYQAGRRREQQLGGEVELKSGRFVVGVVAASIAGLFSAGQNFTFSMTMPVQSWALLHGYTHLAASLLIWPSFLFCAFIPYAIYMIYLGFRHKSLVNYRQNFRLKYCCFVFLMGLFWYGSLVLYSKSAHDIGYFGPIVGWPLFMVFVILTSNFWGWYKKEWQGCSRAIMLRLLSGIIIFVVSVILLGLSYYLHSHRG